MVHPMLFINYIYAESTDHDREFKKQKKKKQHTKQAYSPPWMLHSFDNERECGLCTQQPEDVQMDL